MRYALPKPHELAFTPKARNGSREGVPEVLLDAYALRLRFRAHRRERGMVELTTGGFLPDIQTDPRVPASSPELHGYTVRGTLPRFRLQMRVTHTSPMIPRSRVLRPWVRRPALGRRVPSEPRHPQQRDHHQKRSKVGQVKRGGSVTVAGLTAQIGGGKLPPVNAPRRAATGLRGHRAS